MEHKNQSDVVNEKNEGSMEEPSWVMEIKEELGNMESIPEEKEQANKRKITICKLPPTIRRNLNPLDYEPRIVSFGPYHHGHDSCQQTEKMKKDVVLHYLKRTKKTIDDHVNALRQVVKDLKDKYDELDPKWQQDDDDFLQLMIYDACFFLEILRQDNSPVWNIDGISSKELTENYRHDMLLLENQIPMLVLEKLFVAPTVFPDEQEYLAKSILRFISPRNEEWLRRRAKFLNVLDLYRCSLVFKDHASPAEISQFTYESNTEFIKDLLLGTRERVAHQLLMVIRERIKYLLLVVIRKRIKDLFKTRSRANFHISIPSATVLDKVGIGFTASTTTRLNDISFGHRNLRLPPIFMDGTTKSMFLNMIAFEQVHPPAPYSVSSYICFMSRLLEGEDDVRLLQSLGIIHGPLLVNQVAELFNSLAKDIMHDPDDFLVIHHRVVARKLAESFRYRVNNPLQKDLWQNYLRSPLAIVSVIAAFFLFSLTAVQTVYTVLSYYNPK